MRKEIHLAIADNEVIFRKGLSIIIGKFEGFNICCQADNIQELITQISNAPNMTNICILGIDNLAASDIAGIESLKSLWPQMKLLLISAFNPNYNTSLLSQKGVNGFLMRQMQEKDLLRALLSVYYTNHFNELPGKYDEENPMPFLSANEKLLLNYLCEDIDYAEIAQRMKLEQEAVKDFSNILFEKLNVSSRVGLLLNNYRMGFGI